MDLATVQDQLKQAGVTDLFGTKKEVRALPTILTDDEQIVYATSGLVDGNTVLVLLTQTRILFIDKGLLYGIKSTEIPLDMVNGVSYGKGLILGKVAVTNGASTTMIENIEKGNAPILADRIKAMAEHYKVNLRNPAATSTLDGPDQIRKYKALADDGIITQAEFEAKKAQILGL